MPQATVSVIIPTYNYAQYICHAIESVLGQQYPSENIEIIVIDDGSTDHTKEILQVFIDNHKIHYYYQNNRGKANATYFGIQKARGIYLFTLDADDYFLPEKISTSVNVFADNYEIVHVASTYKNNYQETQAEGIEKLPHDMLEKPLNGNELLQHFYDNNFLYGGGSTFAARTSILKSISIPDSIDMFIDEFLILTVLPHGKSFFINRPLSVWRIHSANYSGKNPNLQEQVEKEQRLIHSSAAVLSYLKSHKFSSKLIKTYTLKDATRRIVFKETLNSKSMTDIFRYASEVFSIQPSWRLMCSYHVFNRLLPNYLYKMLKKVKCW